MVGTRGEPTLGAREKFASFLEDEGDNDETLKSYQGVMIKRQQCLGLNDPGTLESPHKVACVLRKMSRYSEAEMLSRQTWILREHVLGHDNGNILVSRNDLALCLRYHGNIKRALQLDQELLDHKKIVFGPDSLQFRHTMSNLAMNYYTLREFNAAVTLLEEVVTGRKQRLGPKHDLTLLSTHNLGLNLQTQERWHEAETVFCEVLAIRISMLDHTHHLISETIFQLSICLRRQDKNEDAITLAAEALQHHETELGPAHAMTLFAQESMATTLYLCNQCSRAESAYKQYFELRKQTPEKRVSIKLGTFQDFAAVLQRLGRYSEAESWCRRAHKGIQIILGIDHADTLFSAWSLGVCLLRTKRKLPEPETLCRRTIVLREATVGKTHKQTLLMLQLLAFALNLQGRTADNTTQLQDLEARLEEKGQETQLHGVILQDLMNATNSSKHYVKVQSYGYKYLHLREQTRGKDSL